MYFFLTILLFYFILYCVCVCVYQFLSFLSPFFLFLWAFLNFGLFLCYLLLVVSARSKLLDIISARVCVLDFSSIFS